MNRSNVPYIVAAALLVLAVGGWGIFLTGGNHELPESRDAGEDATTSTGDAGSRPMERGDVSPSPSEPPSTMIADSGFALAPPPQMPPDPPAGDMGRVEKKDFEAETDFEAAKKTPTDLPSKRNSDGHQPASISPEAIKGVIAGMRPALKLCYQSLLEDFPTASGKVLVTFRIETEGTDGRVSVIEVNEESTLMDDKLFGCLTDAFGDAIFPVPDGGETVQVTYPFAFAKE